MHYTIQTESIRVAIAAHGAELQSLFDKTTGTEYMWSGDEQFWGKKSPVLFPIVGTLKNNTYFFKGNSYNLPRHGFARDKNFTLKNQADNSLLFTLDSDAGTLAVYPFTFQFSILYTIQGASLSVTYIVKNTGTGAMYFSVGGHPAFKVPLFVHENYEDHALVFNKKEKAGRWPITPEGLIAAEPIPFFNNTDTIHLKKELFQKDAIVFKHLASDSVKLISANSGKGIRFDFGGFPYLGIWAAKNADFICIEPWCGIADGEHSDQLLENKEGINRLEAGSQWQQTWRVTIL